MLNWLTNSSRNKTLKVKPCVDGFHNTTEARFKCCTAATLNSIDQINAVVRLGFKYCATAMLNSMFIIINTF